MPRKIEKTVPAQTATPPPAKRKADPIIIIRPMPLRSKPTVTTAPVARPKVDLVALAKKSLALQEQHTKTPVTKDGFGRTVKKTPAKVVRYIVECDDGTALYAEGEHADVIYRYIQECEQLCNVQGLAYYGGPGMERITRAQLLERVAR